MKLLLVQTGFIGDIILSTPVIAALKQIYPDADLSVMTTPLGEELVRRDPLVQRVIVFDKRGQAKGLRGFFRQRDVLRAERFDMAFSLHRSPRTSLLLWAAGIKVRIGFLAARLGFLYHERHLRNQADHDVLRNLSLITSRLSCSKEVQRLRLFPPAVSEVSPQVRSLIEAGLPYVALFPASEWRTKMWHARGFLETAQHFQRRGLQIVLLGSKKDQSLCQQISREQGFRNLCGETSLSEVMLIVKHAALLVCNDSMAQHLASAFQTPSVTVFCATSPEFGFGPWQNHARVVEREGLACKPCRRHGSQSCPAGTEACMRQVSADQVIQAGEALLNQAV